MPIPLFNIYIISYPLYIFVIWTKYPLSVAYIQQRGACRRMRDQYIYILVPMSKSMRQQIMTIIKLLNAASHKECSVIQNNKS